MPSTIYRPPFGTRLLLWLGSALFRLWSLTVRLELSPRIYDFIKANPQALILLWHNRLGLALMLIGKKAPRVKLTGLVSASRDGAYLAELMKNFGVATVRGSSSRRALGATKDLIGALKAGQSLVITPDGPRGPIYKAKEGIESIGELAPTYVLEARADSYWQLKSWDKFILPKPFSKIRFDINPIGENPSFEEITKRLKDSE